VAQEPITIFARIVDPAGVARLLRKQAATTKLDGPDESWANAVVTFDEGASKRTLTFTHDPEYYGGPGWSQQLAGMRGYFSHFPDSARKRQVMVLTSSFHFAIGSLFEPDFDPDGDERLDLLLQVAQLLDGVLFTPSSLRDAHGRILLSCEGQKHEDPAAEWPRVLGEVSVSTAAGAAMHEISRPGPPNEARDDDDPPIAERVARRALALVAVTGRAILEQDDPKAETVQQTFADLKTWVKDIEITEEFEPEERQLVDCPLGQLEQRQQTDSTWRLEGLVVLAWALQRFEIPPHDEIVQLRPLWRSLGLLDAKVAGELMAKPQLRTRAEIVTRRNQLFALHWRLRNFHITTEAMDFAEFAKTCWFGPMDITGLALVDGDLAIKGQRIDRAEPGAFHAALSTAQERHQAANWLLAGPKLYSDASVAT